MNKPVPDHSDALSMTSPASFPILKKWVSRAIIIIVVLIMMAGFLPKILPSSVSTYVVETWLGSMTDKRVMIKGVAEFTLLPTLSVSATNIKFFNIDTEIADIDGLIDLEAMDFEIASIPLLAGELDIIQLKLDRPRYRYLRSARSAPKTRNIAANKKIKRTQNWGWWRKFSLRSVNIKNAYIDYRGNANNNGLQIAEINLSKDQLGKNKNQTQIIGQAVISGHPVDVTIKIEKIVNAGTGAGVPVVVEAKNNDVDMNVTGMFSLRQNLNGEGIISIQSKNIKSVASLFSIDVLNYFSGSFSLQSGYTFNDERFLMNDIAVAIGSMKIVGDMNASKNSNRVIGKFNAENLNVSLDDLSADKIKAYSSFLKWSKHVLNSWGSGSGVSLNWSGLAIADLKLGSGTLTVSRSEKPVRLIFDVKNLKTYSGVTTAKLRFGAGEAMYALDGKISMQRFNAGALIKDYAGSTVFNGLANLSLSLLSVGASPEQLVSALTGDGSFNVTNGRINDKMIAGNLLAKPAPTGQGTAELGFSQFLGNLSFSQGIVRSQDLLLKAPTLSLIGEGELDLTNQQVDISLQSLMSAPGAKLRTVKPFRIGGSLSALSFQEQ